MKRFFKQYPPHLYKTVKKTKLNSRKFEPNFISNCRDDSNISASDDEGAHSLRPPHGNHGRISGPPSINSAPDALYYEDDLTPKHYIRTPILEETESNVEAELRSRHRSRENPRLRFWNEDPDVSLRFKIQDGRGNSPEPAYAETKASILRRRTTLAKMTQNGRLMAKDRHWSLTDIPRTQMEEEQTSMSYLRRWNSLSNDEMMRIREDHGMITFHKHNTAAQGLPKSNMVQMANISLAPKHDEPRKFSKYNPPRRRRGRNSSEELIYIRQNFPSERNLRTTIWNRHGAPRNIEIQHISGNPTIAHTNSFGPQQKEFTLDVYNTSNASSEFPSRTSSVSNFRQSETNGPYLTHERGAIPKQAPPKEVPGGKKSSQIAPRYMNWYTKSKSLQQPTITTLDAKQLGRKEMRSESVPQRIVTESPLPDIDLPTPRDDDVESGTFFIMII